MRIQNIVNHLTNRWVLFILITWSILILTAGSVFVYYFKNVTLKNQKIQLNEEIKILSEKRDCIDTEKERFNLKDKKLSAILADLLSASKKSGARLGETGIAELIEHETYQAFPVTISIKGNYNQIGRFVNLIEKNLRFKILEVNLSIKETKGAGIISKIEAEFIIL